MNLKSFFLLIIFFFSKASFATDSLIVTQVNLNLQALENKYYDVEIMLFDSYLGKGYQTFQIFYNQKSQAVIKLVMPEISIGMIIIKKGDQVLASSGSVVFSGDSLQVEPDTSRSVLIVKGGENEFMQDNFRLPFNLPSKIANSKFFKQKMVQRTYDLEITENYQFQTTYSEYLRNVLTTVKQYSNSFHILRLLNDNSENINLKTLDTALYIFDEKVINTSQGRRLKLIIANGKWLISKPNLNVVKIENAHGKEISLSILLDSTKFTFIDFWASWCAPCRAFNKKLVQKYDSVNINNLQIVSISIDEDLKQWKTALNNDKLPWLNFIDPTKKGFEGDISQLFNVQYIPQSFLFNNKGEIVDMNLSIEELVSLSIK